MLDFIILFLVIILGLLLIRSEGFIFGTAGGTPVSETKATSQMQGLVPSPSDPDPVGIVSSPQS
jgi:hypothetical protein